MRPLPAPYDDITAGRAATIALAGPALLGNRLLTKDLAFNADERDAFTGARSVAVNCRSRTGRRSAPPVVGAPENRSISPTPAARAIRRGHRRRPMRMAG